MKAPTILGDKIPLAAWKLKFYSHSGGAAIIRGNFYIIRANRNLSCRALVRIGLIDPKTRDRPEGVFLRKGLLLVAV